jgi:hypothetical protein
LLYALWRETENADLKNSQLKWALCYWSLISRQFIEGMNLIKDNMGKGRLDFVRGESKFNSFESVHQKEVFFKKKEKKHPWRTEGKEKKKLEQ